MYIVADENMALVQAFFLAFRAITVLCRTAIISRAGQDGRYFASTFGNTC
jgi:hypothetical protein